MTNYIIELSLPQINMINNNRIFLFSVLFSHEPFERIFFAYFFIEIKSIEMQELFILKLALATVSIRLLAVI